MTRERWLYLWSTIGEPNPGTFAGYNRLREEVNGRDYRYGEWVRGKEIRVFREPTVKAQCSLPVINGIYDMIKEVGVDLQVKYLGDHNSINPLIAESITSRGTLDDGKLGRKLISETYRDESAGGKQHADVILTSLRFDEDSSNWGVSRFSEGCMIMSLPLERQDNLRFIRNVSEHETGHLLGFHQHHDYWKVEGYREPGYCVMYRSCSTPFLCNKDRDAMIYFWRALEKELGMKLF